MSRETIVSDSIVSFKINGRIHDIEISHDENDLYHHLLVDNEYTVDYLNSLISAQVISLDGNLQEIYRVNSNGEIKEKIFPQENRNSENKDKWFGPETSILLEKYEEYIAQVGPLKTFRNKKNMWEQIALDISKELQLKKTSVQVENRFKTLLRRKEYVVRYKFPNKEDDLFKDRLKGVLEKPPKRKYAKSDTLCDSSVDETELSLQKTLEKIHKQKEAGKERRHKEKIMFLKQQEASKERRHFEKLEMLKKLLKNKLLPEDLCVQDMI